MRKHRCWLLIWFLSASTTYGQDADILFSDDSTFSPADSLSIFTLIDSLLNLDELSSSQFAIRLSYNSNVLSAGRTLGIQNFGLAPGISYYHKSGWYADLSGYWSKDFQPKYYLTVVSAGYMKDLSKHFSVMANYDRYFYHFDDELDLPYRNTLSVTPIAEVKNVSLLMNYAFYFGDRFAHRIMPGLSYRFSRKKTLKLDRISITPAVYVLWGNEVITSLEYVRPESVREAIANFRKYGTRFRILEKSKDVFGIMNYAISLPLSVSKGNFGFSFSYTYNIPKALPGETLTIAESTYISASAMLLLGEH